MPDYQTIEDFVADDSFQRWVLSEDPAAGIFWEQFRRQHPEQEEAMLQAEELVRSLRFAEKRPSLFQEKKVWQQIQRELSEKDRHPPRSRPPYPPLGIAASITLIIVGLAVWWGWQRQSSNLATVHTAYGEIREVYLPDSSRVTLNGNSTLCYRPIWTAESGREVWLKGEGFFEVKHMETSRSDTPVKFTVHTSKLKVEVRGTTFDVSDREEQTYVVLTEGRIALNIENETLIQMKPGERFAIRGTSRTYETNPEDISQWSSWKEEELVFRKQPLRDIAAQLRHTYGYQLEFPSDTIAAEKFTASIHRQDIELLFSLIARSFDLNYNIQGNVINFENRH